MPHNEENQILQIATAAFERFQSGWETGNFDSYLAMLADELTFSFPTGAHCGLFTGKKGRRKMIAKCRDDVASGTRLKFRKPRTVAVSAHTVIFEFESYGKLGETDYHGRNSIALDVNNNLISGFREYFGDLDPQLFAVPTKD